MLWLGGLIKKSRHFLLGLTFYLLALMLCSFARVLFLIVFIYYFHIVYY